MKAVPRPLWNDGDHSSTERERLWPVLAHDFQGRSAVENVNQLVAGEMGFPMTFPRKLGGEKGAVAVGSQSCGAALAIRHRRLRGPPTEHCQLRELCVEIDDAGRSALHFSLHLLTAVCVAARRRARATRSLDLITDRDPVGRGGDLIARRHVWPAQRPASKRIWADDFPVVALEEFVAF